MKKGLFIFVLIGICTVGANHSFAQGCSDAGFCTINSFKPNNADSIGAMKNQFKIGAFYGQADYSISVYGSYLEYNRQVSKKLGLDARFTTLAQNGNGISTFGVSDFFINANYKLNKKLKFTLGMKIPLSNAKNLTYKRLTEFLKILFSEARFLMSTGQIFSEF